MSDEQVAEMANIIFEEMKRGCTQQSLIHVIANNFKDKYSSVITGELKYIKTYHSEGVLDLTGMRFGKLLVKKMIRTDVKKGAIWLCSCDCGVEKDIFSYRLRSGLKSCGCLRGTLLAKENKRMYSIWQNMRNRCYNKNIDSYKDYGGRGITVCDSWNKSFISFYEDMIDGYSEKLSLDRIENEDGYFKENCRWATVVEQSKNRRSNQWYQVGDLKMVKMDWARYFGVNHNALNYRLNTGESMEQAYNYYSNNKKGSKHRKLK